MSYSVAHDFRRGTHSSDDLQDLADGLASVVSGGGSLAVFDAKNAYGAVGDGVADDTTKIQAALAAANTAGGGTVYVSRGTYLISASLVIYSNTKLWLDPAATISLKAASSCNMIHNAAWVAGSGRDSNITVQGGVWARGANAGTGQQTHSLLLQRVDQVVVSDLKVTSSAGKYAICLYACTNFAVDRITLNCASDGVHISGASSCGSIRNIWGTTGDDSVAILSGDSTALKNGDMGDIFDISVDGVYTTSTNANLTKVLLGSDGAGTPYTARGVTIQNVRGTAAAAWHGCYVGGDSADGTMQNGTIYDLTIDNVVNLNSGAGANVAFLDFGTTGSADNVTLRRIPYKDGGSSPRTILVNVSVSNGVTIGKLVVRDCYWAGSTSNQGAIQFEGSGGIVTELVLDACKIVHGNGAYMVRLLGTSSSVSTLKATDCTIANTTTGAGLFTTNGATTPTLSNVMVSNLTAGRCAFPAGDYAAAISTNVWVYGCNCTTVTALVNVRAGVTVNLQTVTGLQGAHARHIANAGTLNGQIVSQGTGAPSIAGQVGDLYDRQDGGAATYRYRCTVAGDDGAATWTGIL